MKYLLITLALLMLVVSAAAQDITPVATVEAAPVNVITAEDGGTVNVSSPTETSEQPATTSGDILVYGVVVALVVLLIAASIFGGRIVTALSTLVPPETAASIYQSGVRLGLQLALDNAATTTSTLDDEFLEGWASTRGFVVIKRADGHYDVQARAVMNTAGLPDTSTLTRNVPPDPIG